MVNDYSHDICHVSCFVQLNFVYVGLVTYVKSEQRTSITSLPAEVISSVITITNYN